MRRFVSLLAVVLAAVAGAITINTASASASACTPNPCYYYAGVGQNVDFDGVGVGITKDNPTIDTLKAWHSLAELSVRDNSGLNIVEVGWTKDSTVCAAGVSICLFFANWVNGTFGCYNGCGAVNAVGCSPYCLGASLDGIANGTQKSFTLQHICNPTCSWWASFDGTWRFTIPDSDWGANAFTVGKRWDTFGEVAAKDTTTCADMAGGVFPTGSPTFLGGKFASITLVNGAAAVSGTAIVTDSSRWNAFMVSGTSARWGGTGGC
jgi:hypothetical protein